MRGSSLTDTYDVIICGAGPGGAAAALCLQESGLRVALLDKHDFPRDKICGDALSGKVTAVLKYIRPELVDHLFHFPKKVGSYGIRFFSPGRHCLDIPFKRNIDALTHAPGFVSRRMEFDDFLLRQAIASDNIHWFPEHPVTAVKISEAGVEVSSGEVVFHGKVVIGADGAHSQVAKSLGIRHMDKRFHSAGVRAYVQGVTGFHDKNFIELHYLEDLLPGYFWIFPLPNGAANVGLGMLSADLAKKPRALRKVLEEIMQSHPDIAPRFSHSTLEGPIVGFGLPLGSRKIPISSARAMLVGDAASLIDPFSGEGIGNAMISGRIAAQTILRLWPEQAFDAKSLQSYDDAVYRKLGQELRLSRTMQKMVRFPKLFDFFVRKSNQNSSLKLLITMMFESVDLRKELARPYFYWDLLMGGDRMARRLRKKASRETAEVRSETPPKSP